MESASVLDSWMTDFGLQDFRAAVINLVYF